MSDSLPRLVIYWRLLLLIPYHLSLAVTVLMVLCFSLSWRSAYLLWDEWRVDILKD
jgi:hypothetical protein